MKNLLLTGFAAAGLLISCSTAKTAQDNRAEFLKLKGDWQVTSVDYDKSFSIKPFDEGADAQCFVGSNWKLVPNNYSGSYSLNGGGDCPVVNQPIKFEVLNGNTFQFKKIMDGTKAKQNEVGYSLTLVGQTENSFSLQQSVPFEGEMVNVIYRFSKIQ
ncbi:lipocalin family protein [Chryseobacterium sp. MFBS3-17]|uniref:lipocalin family protein n=1 Tax=Chryseobacterium sp. MFBS3-17 TaxID=2886689 RepID=UPI001D0EDA3E|nr:lipocalin family protein [Chryseobacterium sp. MFBS3-17]MCC2590755.1 lipocalin family protein [Chryseobacterium sp. MFBS3-17]